MIREIAKINIVGRKDRFNDVMEALHSLGNIQLEEISAEINDEERQAKENIFNEELAKIDYKIAQANFAIKFLEAQETSFKGGEREKKISLRDRILDSKIKITREKFETLLKTYNWEEIVNRCEKAEEGLNNAKNKINALKIRENELKKWKGIHIGTKDLEETQTTKSFLAEVSEMTYNKFEEIFKEFELVAWEKIKEQAQNIFVLITYAKAIGNPLSEHLAKNNISSIDIPQTEESPEKELLKIKDGIKEEERVIKEISHDIKSLLHEEKNLKIIYDCLNWEKDKIKSSLQILQTDYVFCISCWTARDNFKKIQNEIHKISPQIVIEEAEITESADKIPVILKNKDIASPFEMVTDMYGAPLYNEPDPTPFLAPFFILFFALAITDAMYGLVLAIAAYAIIKYLKLPKEESKLFRIIFYGGIVTFFVGALFGGWFGAVLEDLPPALGGALIKLRWINPMTEPIKFLLFTFALGIIQIISGLGVAMYWKFKQGRFWDGIMDHGFWILLLLSLSLWAATASSPIAGYFKISALISAILMVLTLGRDAGNFFVRLAKGFYGLYGITAYFSDMLSYSRLLALGLATGIIGMVINIIAGISIKMVPIVGWILAIIILIVGHLFNIGINVLGAYIHSSRLQYVEFFPKFMEGGGKAFQPFKKESKYVKITD